MSVLLGEQSEENEGLVTHEAQANIILNESYQQCGKTTGGMRPAKVCILRSARGWLSHEAFYTNRDPTTIFSLLKLRIPVL